jgi:hypothetical protein
VDRETKAVKLYDRGHQIKTKAHARGASDLVGAIETSQHGLALCSLMPQPRRTMVSPFQQAAIIALFRVVNRYVGNLAPMPGVFPDYKAPIARYGAEGRELVTARWGMPSSQQALLEATKKRAAKLGSGG